MLNHDAGDGDDDAGDDGDNGGDDDDRDWCSTNAFNDAGDDGDDDHKQSSFIEVFLYCC